MSNFKVKLNTKIISLLIAFSISILLIRNSISPEIRFDEFALGDKTSSYFAIKNDKPIHFDRLTEKSVEEINKGWIQRGSKDVVFILGNSQTHSINQMKTDELNYVKLLSDSLSKNIDILAHTFPNANTQEMLFSYLYFKNNYPVKYLIIPLFFDDFREDFVREYFFEYLIKNFHKNEKYSLIQSKIKNISRSDDSNAGIDGTYQEKSERYLNNKLLTFSELWKSREKMRGDIFIKLYLLRNSFFGINASSNRKIIRNVYNDNMNALNHILYDAKENKVNVILYIPPIRYDIDIPYDSNEYDSFKSEISKISDSFTNVKFFNLEKIIPANYWGMTESTNLSSEAEYDFMHFQYSGHKILFQELKNIIEQHFK
ncbi:MAG: hypothetical protein CMF42_03685 [Legionellales bacterium]|nr:hypothetical protein [Legionellales bacterium]